MRPIQVLLIVLLVFLGGGSTPVTSRMDNSLVAIQALDYDGEWSVVGSGVQVNTWRHRGILTARHVASIPRDLRACNHDECVELGSYVTGEQDYAIFPVVLRTGSAARVRWTPVRPGEAVTHLGYPWGVRWVSTGVVAHVGADIICDLDIGPGSSGGPVYDEQGRLIGIAVAVEIKQDRANGLPTMLYWRSHVVPVADIFGATMERDIDNQPDWKEL